MPTSESIALPAAFQAASREGDGGAIIGNDCLTRAAWQYPAFLDQITDDTLEPESL